MTTKKLLGKISKVTFGVQDSSLGLHLTFSAGTLGVQCSRLSFHDKQEVPHSEHCKWDEHDRNNNYADIMCTLSGILSHAKVREVSQLKDIPVELTVEDGLLKFWRVLTEVL